MASLSQKEIQELQDLKRRGLLSPEKRRLYKIAQDRGLIPKEKGFLSALTSPTVVGATGGAMLGATFGPPGAVAGTMIGAAAGRLGEGLAAGESPREIGLGMASEAGTQGLFQAVGGPAVGAIGRGASRALGPVARRVGHPLLSLAESAGANLSKGAGKAVGLTQRFGGQMLPNQLTESRLFDTFAAIADTSFTGGGIMAKAARKQGAVNENIARFLAKGFIVHRNPTATGAAVQDALSNGDKLFRSAASQLYRRVDDLVPNTIKVERELVQKSPILTSGGQPFERTVTQTVEEGIVPTDGLKAIASNPDFRRILRLIPSRTGQSISSAMKTLPDSISFKDAAILRSDLLKEFRLSKAGGILGSEDRVKQMVLARMSSQVTKDMKMAANALSEDGVRAFELADKFFRTGARVFNDKFVAKLAREDPATVVNSMLRPGRINGLIKIMDILKGTALQKSGQATGVAVAKQAGDAATLDRLRTEVVKGVLDLAIDKGRGEFSTFGISRAINQVGAPALRRILDKQTFADLNSFAHVIRLQNVKPRTPGEFSIMLRQPTALAQLAATGLLVVGNLENPEVGAEDVIAGLVVLGPRFLAKILTTPGSVQKLTKAMMTKPGKAEARQASSQLLEEIIKIAGRSEVKKVVSQLEEGNVTELEIIEKEPSGLEEEDEEER